MGLYLPPNATVGDMPVAHIQETLNEFGSYNPRATPAGQPAGVTPFCIETKGWTEHEHWAQLDHVAAVLDFGFGRRDPASKNGTLIVLTEEGEALRLAKLANRVPVQKADSAFAQLQQNVERLNAEGIVRVEELWIYGSYMRREPSVGDIDVAAKIGDAVPIGQRAALIAQTCADEPWYQEASRGGRNPVPGQVYAEARLFGGNKRHPLLQEGQATLHTLVSMPVACQRVYTAENGWVQEPVMARHPDAPEQDPPNRRPRVEITIDQGVFSSVNDGKAPLSRDERLHAVIQGSAQRVVGSSDKESLVKKKSEKDGQDRE